MPRDPVSASAPPLVDPHTARDPIPFACGLAFGDTWFLVSVLGFGFGRLGSMSPRFYVPVPCAMLPSPSINPARAWLSPPLAPQCATTCCQ
eukprot:scaffold79349_cov55-Phaeocystis_antarctica.AAC.3